MADSDKNIVITPATGTASNPNIEFTGFNNSSVSAIVQDDGTIIFEGAAGELMSISNSDDGTLFTANNLSGIAMIETNDSDVIAIAHNGTDKLGVGTDSPSVTFDAEADSATVAHFNRTTSDGSVIDIQKDGTTVGSIGSSSGSLYIQGNSVSSGFYFGNSNVYPWDAGALADNTIDLGQSSYRWKDLYLGGSVYLGGTGAVNALDDYEEGSWTPTGNGITFSFAQGRFTKIGRIVFIQGQVNFPSTSDTSQAIINGLPITVGNIDSNNVGTASIVNTGSDNLYVFNVAGTTQMFIRNNSNSNLQNTNLSGNLFTFMSYYIV